MNRSTMALRLSSKIVPLQGALLVAEVMINWSLMKNYYNKCLSY
ncbi:hypothetical protein [Niallia sp. 03133]